MNVIFGQIASPFFDLGFSLAHVDCDCHFVAFQDFEGAIFVERQSHSVPRDGEAAEFDFNFEGSNFTPLRPAAARIRPQFASAPAMAVLTSGLVAMVARSLRRRVRSARGGCES